MDLSTTYLGMELRSPIVPGASPLSRDLDTPRRLEDAGAGAIIMESLFEEQLATDATHLKGFSGETEYDRALPVESRPNWGEHESYAEEYLERLYALKESLSIPVIASLNCATLDAWTEVVEMIEQAGADALELNVYFLATDPDETGADVEDRFVDIVRAVRHRVNIPIAVKLSPYFSALSNIARRLEKAHIDGLVLFNRFFQPDVDIEDMTVHPAVTFTGPEEIRLPLTWIAILRNQVDLSLAASGGVTTGRDALKMLAVGADIVQMTSALLRRGPEHLKEVSQDIKIWLHWHELDGVGPLRGRMSYDGLSTSGIKEREAYMEALKRYPHERGGTR